MTEVVTTVRSERRELFQEIEENLNSKSKCFVVSLLVRFHNTIEV